MVDRSASGPDGTIRTLFRHNVWANAKLFDLCATCTDEQLNTSITGTYGTVRETLQHIATAERSYLHRLETGTAYIGSDDEAMPSMAELQAMIRRSGEGFVELAPTIQPEDAVEVNWDGTPRSVPSTVILTQVINHATEHRAQIMATLTQLDIQPPDLDGWSYFDANESG